MNILEKSDYTVDEMAKLNSRNKVHFFAKGAMDFFGDKFSSFDTCKFKGDNILYRKLGAEVNCFGKTETVTKKEFFGAWKFSAGNGGLRSIGNEEKDSLLRLL